MLIKNISEDISSGFTIDGTQYSLGPGDELELDNSYYVDVLALAVRFPHLQIMFKDDTALDVEYEGAVLPVENVREALEFLDSTKANKADCYTKTEIDASLDLKADKAVTYTKTEVDAQIDLDVAEAIDYIDNIKADRATTYTKAEIDATLAFLGGVDGIDEVLTKTNVFTTEAFLTELDQNTSYWILELPVPFKGHVTKLGIRLSDSRLGGTLKFKFGRNSTPLTANDLDLYINAINPLEHKVTLEEKGSGFLYEEDDNIGILMETNNFSPLLQRIEVYFVYESDESE